MSLAAPLVDDVPAALVSLIREGLQVDIEETETLERWIEGRASNIAMSIISLCKVELLPDIEETDPIRVVARRTGA